MAEQQPKVMRVIAGSMLMLAFLLILASVVGRYAGAWGVPFFSYTSERGSACENTVTGYVCDPLTLTDVEYYTDIDLPNQTRVLAGRYTATHDWQLTARLSVSKAEAPKALAVLNAAFGPCRSDRPAPAELTGVGQVCTLANDDAIAGAGEPASRLWVIGTGVAKNGTRTITMAMRSR